MTIDTSNPNKTPWGEMDRATKAEILLQEIFEGATTEEFYNDMWHLTTEPPHAWTNDMIVRIEPEPKRQTVHGYVIVSPETLPLACVTWETVDGEIDKSVEPSWVK